MNLVLLKIAEEIIKLNENHQAALGGSLFLQLIGVNIQREQKDIDIILDKPILELDIKVPEGWKQYSGKTSKMVTYTHTYLPFNIDFIYSTEDRQIIKGINCGNIENILKTKREYIANGNPNFAKHNNDILMIELWLFNKVK